MVYQTLPGGPFLNDIVVTTQSANPSYGKLLVNVEANHTTVRNGSQDCRDPASILLIALGKSIMSKRYTLQILMAMALTTLSISGQPQAVAVVGLPETATADISVGATSVVLLSRVTGCSAIVLDVIAPVNGVTLTVINPADQVVLPSGDSRVQFTPGSLD